MVSCCIEEKSRHIGIVQGGGHSISLMELL
jgi:hypothetical protein